MPDQEYSMIDSEESPEPEEVETEKKPYFGWLKIWILGTLVILYYLARYNLGSTKDLSSILPYIEAATIFLIILGIAGIIENARKRETSRRIITTIRRSREPRIPQQPETGLNRG
jgi:hypothetical protein